MSSKQNQHFYHSPKQPRKKKKVFNEQFQISTESILAHLNKRVCALVQSHSVSGLLLLCPRVCVRVNLQRNLSSSTAAPTSPESHFKRKAPNGNHANTGNHFQVEQYSRLTIQANALLWYIPDSNILMSRRKLWTGEVSIQMVPKSRRKKKLSCLTLTKYEIKYAFHLLKVNNEFPQKRGEICEKFSHGGFSSHFLYYFFSKWRLTLLLLATLASPQKNKTKTKISAHWQAATWVSSSTMSTPWWSHSHTTQNKNIK